MAKLTLIICAVYAAVSIVDGSGSLGSVHCRVGCACAQDYAPLCANDRRTYENECKLRCKQCDEPGLKAVFEGRCEDNILLSPAPVAFIPATAVQPQYYRPARTLASSPLLPLITGYAF